MLILSDRSREEGRAPLPMVLMTSALHNTLVLEGQRRHAGLGKRRGGILDDDVLAVSCRNGHVGIVVDRQSLGDR